MLSVLSSVSEIELYTYNEREKEKLPVKAALKKRELMHSGWVYIGYIKGEQSNPATLNTEVDEHFWTALMKTDISTWKGWD